MSFATLGSEFEEATFVEADVVDVEFELDEPSFCGGEGDGLAGERGGLEGGVSPKSLEQSDDGLRGIGVSSRANSMLIEDTLNGGAGTLFTGVLCRFCVGAGSTEISLEEEKGAMTSIPGRLEVFESFDSSRKGAMEDSRGSFVTEEEENPTDFSSSPSSRVSKSSWSSQGRSCVLPRLQT